jgi:hypothetical protein
MPKSINVLITGYTSQIGRGLLHSLSELNAEIFAAGKHPPSDHPFIHWIPWGLGQKIDTSSLPRMDIVIHLAWETKFRKKNYHLNVGGSLQLLNSYAFRDSIVIFVSSIAALNPHSYYGAAKKSVEENALAGQLRIIRPGLVLGVEKYGNKLHKLRIVPSAKSPVYLTHLNCLLSELVGSISDNSVFERNVVCKVAPLSDLLGVDSRYISIPGKVAEIILRIASKSGKIHDVLDAYISLRTTPTLRADSCAFRCET